MEFFPRNAYIDQYTEGWRYRVMNGPTMIAGSVMFSDFEESILALQRRFPGMRVEKVIDARG